MRENAEIASLVQHISISTHMAMSAGVLNETHQYSSATSLLASMPVLRSLQLLTVVDDVDTVPQYAQLPRRIIPSPTPHLTHLDYVGGTPLQLARLLEHLPHLISLHIGQFITYGQSLSLPVVDALNTESPAQMI